eukprot:TRINITY_DN20448_c0_g1_i1.p1 TRINITY_DN20448_c0_g1~~TRINITY_DN20448_c0_g1_i1.p1  ORF type:complete len:503 (-),score=91.09 TRINITY_DN20448_c0_g1_i1:197-1705(-)
MAGNGGGNSSRNGGSAEPIFPNHEQQRRWGGCLGGLSCFGSQKRGKRIVPASRMPDGNTSANRTNGPQPVGLSNQATNLTPSLLAPPSSPASFTNSALPSTAQSPSCFLTNSPGGPSSTMFATGPYAHETQLVSPPVFSTFTTEPSTAPLTPPPELAHPTTPSSPDVPFAQFLSSSLDLRSSGKENGLPFMSSGYVPSSDLQTTYPLYPESPASSLISPKSGTSRDGLSSSFPDREFTSHWGASNSAQDAHYPRNGPSKLFGLDNATSRNFMLSDDCSFFCPATSAQFYLDQAQQSFPYGGGRLSVSKEADVYSSSGNAHQNRHNKTCKQDVEEIEAYRASFGFSADEIVSTPHYVEITDVLDDSFSISPFASNQPYMEESTISEFPNRGANMQTTTHLNLLDPQGLKPTSNLVVDGVDGKVQDTCNGCTDPKSCKQSGKTSPKDSKENILAAEEEDLLSKMGEIKVGRRKGAGLSSSDAEIDYGRGRSVKNGNRDVIWCDD